MSGIEKVFTKTESWDKLLPLDILLWKEARFLAKASVQFLNRKAKCFSSTISAKLFNLFSFFLHDLHLPIGNFLYFSSKKTLESSKGFETTGYRSFVSIYSGSTVLGVIDIVEPKWQSEALMVVAVV